MIRLSRLNGATFYLNAELVEQIESTPDTVITLVGGKTVMVAEPINKVLKRIFLYKYRIHRLRPRTTKNSQKGQL